MSARPPALAAWLLSRLLDRDSYEAVAGDLDEEFAALQDRRGRLAAARWYWTATLRSIVTCRVTGERRVQRRQMDFDGGSSASLRDFLRPALRQFRDQPIYAAATVGTLALAIGVGSVTMTVVKRAFLDPLPYRDDARLHSVLTSIDGDGSAVAPAVLEDLRRSSSPFVGLAPARPVTMAYAAADATESVTGNLVTSEYFAVIGVTPALGRVWTAAEPDAIVVSWRFWATTLQSDPEVISRVVMIDGRARTIVGVLPSEFVPPYWPVTAVWAPLDLAPLLAEPRSRRTLSVFARRADHVSEAEVAAFLEVFSRNQQQQHPDVHGRHSWIAPTVRAELVGPARPAVLGAGAAALLLLMLVAANLAGLSAAHAAATAQQVAIRSALGATRSRLFTEQLIDTLVLTGLGSLLGVWMAYGLTQVIAQYQQQFLPRLAPIQLDASTIAAALAVGLLIGLVASVLPRSLIGVQPEHALRAARGASADRRLTRTRVVLVMGQVALSLVLLVGAGLLIRTVRHLTTLPLGFRPDHLVMTSVNLPLPKYASAEAQLQFERTFVERASQIHGVEAVAASVGVPIIGGMMAGLAIKGDTTGGARPEIAYLSVAPNYLSTIGATVVAGRGLLPTDTQDAPRVVVINETMARQFWPQGNALGQEVHIGPGAPADRWITVVGVMADMRTHGPTEAIRPAAFGSTLQYSWPRRHLTMRTDGPTPATLTSDLRAVLHAIDPSIPAGAITTVESLLAERTGRHRLASLALTLFGALSLVLCGSGLYAVVALTSRLRTREYAIRMALGARTGDVRWLVFKQALLIAGVGTAAGLAAAAGGTRILDGLLHGVGTIDRPIFVAACAALLTLAGLAAWQPARQAVRVNPIDTLKAE
jgi:predicted permease